MRSENASRFCVWVILVASLVLRASLRARQKSDTHGPMRVATALGHADSTASPAPVPSSKAR